MNQTDKNVALLREGYRLWNDTKADSTSYWVNLLADNVKWNSLADGAPGIEFTRGANGKAAVLEYFAGLTGTWAMLHYTVEEFIAQDDRVVAICRCAWKHKVTGKVVETPKADVVRMKDGKVVEFYEFYDTAKMLSASR